MCLGVIHSCELLPDGSLWQSLPPPHPLPVSLSLSPSLCSCVSPDVHEWRSVQLEETLPVPAGLHRAALPVSPPPDAAGSGSARQQAARLPHISEARRPQTRGAVSHRAHPADANALNFHPALDTSRAPLVWRCPPFNPQAFATLGRSEWRGKRIWLSSFFPVFSADKLTRSPHAGHPCGHSTPRPIRYQASSQDGATPDPLEAQTEGALLPGDHAQTSCECRRALKKWRTVPKKKKVFVLSFPTDNVSLSGLALVQQHPASCSHQPGGLLRHRGELMGTEQVLSVPQATEWVTFTSGNLCCFKFWSLKFLFTVSYGF